jgi:ArsR family transcriptional regulator, arsenate/arsenite/antimonite-responsive transcriptional repressor
MEVFGLAMSTISKHLSILAAADLVVSRKEGRWAYYNLPSPHENETTAPILEWIQNALQQDDVVAKDRQKLTTDVSCSPQVLRKRQTKGKEQ